MKKLIVKTSKTTGFTFLPAVQVKEAIDELREYLKSVETAQEGYHIFLDNRIDELREEVKELKYDLEQIKTELHVNLDILPINDPHDFSDHIGDINEMINGSKEQSIDHIPDVRKKADSVTRIVGNDLRQKLLDELDGMSVEVKGSLSEKSFAQGFNWAVGFITNSLLKTLDAKAEGEI